MQRALPVHAAQLRQGKALSRVLSQPPGLFTQLQLQLLAVGESTGALHSILERLASDSERSNRLWMRIANALAYPALVLAVSLVLVVFAQNLVFKDLLGFLERMGVDLPWTTRLMSASARILSSPYAWLLLAAGIAGLVATLNHVARTPSTQKTLWSLAFRLPGLGTALRTALAVDFCRALALCQTAGVPILQGLELSASGTANPVLNDRIGRVRARVAEGELLHRALRGLDFFPPLVCHFLAAGEKTGKVPFLLERAATVCEESMEQILETASAALQPIVLMIVAGLVGFVVIATMTPMLKVVEAL